MSTFNTRFTLIQKISKEQDEELWQEFVHYYRRYLYVVVRNMNLGHHDTEEIIQSIMLKVWGKLKDFQYSPSKGKFRYWLCTIARNCVIDFTRKKQSQDRRREGLQQDKAVNEQSAIVIPQVEEIAEREWQNYIANAALENIRSSFNEKKINCFILFTQGKSVKEISQATNLAENSVYIYKATIQNELLKEVKRLEQELD